jgi:hypothetical protein
MSLSNLAKLPAQTSSCSEPELLTSIDYNPVPAQTWQFGLAVDYKGLSRLVMNSTRLADDSRTRLTKALVLRTRFGITSKISASAIVNLVQKEVELRLPAVGREFLRTRGLGDSYLLTEYTFIPWDLASGRKLSAGAGFKLPTGVIDYESEEIIIHEDMQPGTGSFGMLIFGNAIYRLHPLSPAYLYLDSYFLFNTKNKNDYKYGNEFSGSAGFLFLPEYPGKLTTYVKYKSGGKHKDNAGAVVSNTGGRWLSLVWDVKADLKKNMFGRFSIEFPLKSDLEGTQLTADYNLTLSLQYTR